MNRLSSLSLAVVVGAAALGLTGCGVRITDAAADPTPAVVDASPAPSRSATASSAAPSATAQGEVENTHPTGLVDDERMARLQRARWTDKVSQHVVCIDGAYTVDRNADALVVDVSGECREVTIVAAGAIVLLPAVDTLTVQGDGNIVVLVSAARIEVDAEADANLIGWEAGTPAVVDAGVLNGTTPIVH